MKKFGNFTFMIIKILLLAALLFFCMSNTATVKYAVREAVMRCIDTVIPSLYGMMILSSLIVSSGILSRIPTFAALIGRKLFGMEKTVFPIFIFSLFAGYPVGAKMLCSQYEKGIISKRRAEIFSGICFGAGPAFIYGCISAQLYGNSTAGRIIIISAVSANIILAFIISPVMKKSIGTAEECRKITLNAEIINRSILSGAEAMSGICIMITAFSVLSAFLSESFIAGKAGAILCLIPGITEDYCDTLIKSILDVTAAAEFPRCNYNILPVICGLSSFGGICVLFQITAVTAGKLSVIPMLILRTAASLLSMIICRLIMPYMISDTVAAASSVSVKACSAASPIPSFILIIMTVYLFSDYEDTVNSKKHITLSVT